MNSVRDIVTTQSSSRGMNHIYYLITDELWKISKDLLIRPPIMNFKYAIDEKMDMII